MIRLLIRIYILLVAIAFSRCTGQTSHDIKAIGLQPIGDCTPQQLLFLQEQIRLFFNKPVVILDKTDMPRSFLNLSKGERYSADSIIKWLSHRTNDSIAPIIGFTHKDIYTTVKDGWGNVKEPAYKYEVWGIFGLGYQPGPSSVISDHRLQTNNIQKFQHRLRTVAIHELGHNLGLPHCSNPHCIMNDANEKIQTVDNSADDYCEPCRNRVKITRPHHK